MKDLRKIPKTGGDAGPSAIGPASSFFIATLDSDFGFLVLDFPAANPQHTSLSTFISSAPAWRADRSSRTRERKILEVRGGGRWNLRPRGAPPEFLVLLLEAGRFATYVGLMKVEGWSNVKAAGSRIAEADEDGRWRKNAKARNEYMQVKIGFIEAWLGVPKRGDCSLSCDAASHGEAVDDHKNQYD